MENQEHISRFVSHLKAMNLSKHRTHKYIYYLNKMASWLKRDFRRAEKTDIEEIVARINALDKAGWTKCEMKTMLKTFYKWLEGDGEEYPKKVRWIKPGMVKNKMLPEQLLTTEEVMAMIKACYSIKEKAFVSALYEGAFRIGELRPMRIKHVEPNGYGIRITVPNMGKTGLRKVLLINSVPYLSNWLAHHPDRENPEAYLWICESNYGKKGKVLSYNTLRKVLKKAARKAGVTKPVNPHSFRHARLTYLSKHLKEAELKEYAGWTGSSRMAGVYVHLSARDTDEAVLRMHGIVTSEGRNKDEALTPRKCPRCEKLNEPDARICCRCGLPLDVRTAIDLKERSDIIAEVMPQEMIDRLVELVVERLKSQNGRGVTSTS
jgi:integrase